MKKKLTKITELVISDDNEELSIDAISLVTSPAIEVDFVFFGKERSVNEASIVGYYGEFKFLNNSKSKAELFSTACEITESSK